MECTKCHLIKELPKGKRWCKDCKNLYEVERKSKMSDEQKNKLKEKERNRYYNKKNNIQENPLMIDTTEIKICSVCYKEKTLDKFYIAKCKGNVRSECKLCCSLLRKNNYQNNKDKIIKQTSNYKKNKIKNNPLFKLEVRLRARICLKNISSRDQWCSYCSHQKLCENNDCSMCLNNSFASIERSQFLNDKTINPRTLFRSTNKKYKFNCDKCYNLFDTPLSAVTNGNWCPNCVNKTEEKLYNELTKHYNVKRQFKPIWGKNLKTNKYLPFDFILEELKIIVEQDGPQHFKQIGDWQSPELTKINDVYKMKCANENGYSIIRLLQKDIWHDRYDWLQELLININKIVSDNVVQNIYMCKKDEYKDFDISI